MRDHGDPKEPSPSTRVTRLALIVAVPLVLLLGAHAISWAAAAIKTWTSGERLTSSDLNGNFANINAELDKLSYVVSKNSTYSKVLSYSSTGAIASISLTPPADGYVVVNWSVTVGLNTGSQACEVYVGAYTSLLAPGTADPGLSYMYAPSSVAFQQASLSGVSVLPVAKTGTTIYLNGNVPNTNCGTYWRAPNITARYVPTATVSSF